MDFQTARAAMVESQIRPNGVRNPRIINAFATTPRELFVPENMKPLAYIDEALRIEPDSGGRPRFLLPPMILARLLEYGEPGPSDKVLVIGAATGYSAAVLAKLCGQVWALEESDALTERMQACLQAAKSAEVHIVRGPLNRGYEPEQPYDLILLDGFAAEEPRGLFGQLAEGGRLLALIGGRWHGQAHVFTKSSGVVSGRPVFDASGEILPGFEAQPQFVL
jgi:protein-L-isoaspartate(D-aspartate) O-methyltransferase